jgi:hypothetical protein
MGAAARFLQKKKDKINHMTGYPIITEKTINIIFARTMEPRYFLSTKIAISQQVFE